MSTPLSAEPPRSPLAGVLRFFLANPLLAALVVVGLLGWGVSVAPFDWRIPGFPRHPVPVDAIPNLGENQQIVAVDWPDQAPGTVQDQVVYPLSAALMAVPGVKEVRSTAMFGFGLIFLIFEEGLDFDLTRARILEKLNSLPPDLLPREVRPTLGPPATALGQVYWYTLEGRDESGQPVGGWDLDELRSLQDFYLRPGLLAAEGVAEVASVGGHVREYQVEVQPEALRVYGVSLAEVVAAVEHANLDVGAGVTELNGVEYVIRGRGLLAGLGDLEEAVVAVREGRLPIRLRDVASVSLGPAPRRGVLTVGGAEAVGGIVVVREGYNPLAAINNVKARLRELQPGLPARAVVDWLRVSRSEVERFAAAQGFAAFAEGQLQQQRWVEWLRAHPRAAWPDWVRLSQVTVVPVYDRTGLILETLGTLRDALLQQILITVLVVLVMVGQVRPALVISATLPLAVLGGFVAMKLAGVEANVVALAGIAIAIGTIVDVGLIITENALRHLGEAPPGESRREVVWRGVNEVAGAVLTALATTVVSFLPVFTMTGAEGKMFTPLAFTKTFVLVASLGLAFAVVPSLVLGLLARGARPAVVPARVWGVACAAAAALGVALAQGWTWVGWVAVAVLASVAIRGVAPRLPAAVQAWLPRAGMAVAAFGVTVLLAGVWEPLGPEGGRGGNLAFVVAVVGGVLGAFRLVQRHYAAILGWCLAHKGVFLLAPGTLLLLGAMVWLGFARLTSPVVGALERLGMGEQVRRSAAWHWAVQQFPGLGREFLPPLDEGSFLWMPTTMPHASLGEVLEVLSYQDRAIASVPEVEAVVGKLGRAETALDPAPVSMIETLITYKSEYLTDAQGRRLRFRYDAARGEFARDPSGQLIPDPRGRYFRQWREHIRSPQDIWEEIVAAAALPGTTSAPKLQPIETRQVMLQTGLRAPLGLKLYAPDLDTLDRMAVALEGALKGVPAIRPDTVSAERVMGKPYLEVRLNRRAIARWGLNAANVQREVAAAVGGVVVTTTVEGRERYAVRVRYPRERRSELEDLERVQVAAADGTLVPLAQLAEVVYVRGSDMIRSEDTFFTAYVTFGGQPGLAEVDVVEAARAALEAKVASGELVVPEGVSWRFAGTWEQRQHAMATLRVVLPLALALIFLILYFQFRSLAVTGFIFAGIGVAWAGGFVMMHLYGQGWVSELGALGVKLGEVFPLGPVNLSVAVWVGFLALFGIAVDDGVLMATYVSQRFRLVQPDSVARLREETIFAGSRRVRPALMTSATTILALLPVLTSSGRGSDVMIPMAIPTVGGMTFALLTMFTVPVLCCWWAERRLRRGLAPLP